jgi:drug/metabolite transporter (DMT)-like permease
MTASGSAPSVRRPLDLRAVILVLVLCLVWDMGESPLHTTAAHTIVFLYTAPIFTALGLQMLPEERLGRLQWAGIGVAFLELSLPFWNSAVGPPWSCCSEMCSPCSRA